MAGWGGDRGGCGGDRGGGVVNIADVSAHVNHSCYNLPLGLMDC